jgi:hypothetical protein
MRNTYFFISAIKKECEKYILLKKHVFLTCQWIHVNLICELYNIFYKQIRRQILSSLDITNMNMSVGQLRIRLGRYGYGSFFHY